MRRNSGAAGFFGRSADWKSAIQQVANLRYSPSAMETVAVARLAMATRFEILLEGRDPVALRAAGEEALDEIERLDSQLSLYRSTSEISRVNACAAFEPVRLEAGLFALLEHARRLHQETEGAFDITVGPLMRCWGFMRGTGRKPSRRELHQARSAVGMHLVLLDENQRTVRFARQGVMIDLGAIGKGYALERAAEVLREAGVSRALLHGGTSTVYGLGRSETGSGWKIAIDPPPSRSESLPAPAPGTDEVPAARPLAVVELTDAALSVSAVWGKAFQAKGKVYGHVIDPRTGAPVDGAVLAAVVLPSATETDALSTALLILGTAGCDAIVGLRPGMRALVVGPRQESPGCDVAARGIDLLEPAHEPGNPKSEYRNPKQL